MGKRKVEKYPRVFRESAVERMRKCDSVLELAKELAVHRSVLYQWRDQLAPLDRPEWREQQETGASPLEQENRRLKQALADKTLEVPSTRGATGIGGSARNCGAAGCRYPYFSPKLRPFRHDVGQKRDAITARHRSASVSIRALAGTRLPTVRGRY